MLGLVALVTLPSIWALSTAEFSTSVVESFVDRREDYLAAMEQERKYVSNPDSLVWLGTDEGNELFSHATLTSIAGCADQIRQLPYVVRVVCITDLDVPSSPAGPMRSVASRAALAASLRQGKIPAKAREQLAQRRPLSKYLDALEEKEQELTPGQSERLREDLRLSSPLGKRIISEDGSSHVMLLELVESGQLSPPEQVAVTRELNAIVTENGLGVRGVFLTGVIPIQGFAFSQINQVLWSLLPIGGLLIAISVFVVFRRLEVILFTLSLAAVAICWGIGLGIVVYGKFSVLMAAVPLMVLVIATADVIHLLSSYTAERGHGADHATAVARMFKQVGGACVLTSLTTFVGFASLVMVPSNTIRQFGFSTAAGVASALLLSVILIPIFLQWLHNRGKAIAGQTVASASAERVAGWCLSLALARPKSIALLTVCVLTMCAVRSSGLTLDPDLTKRFSKRHQAATSADFFIDRFGGFNSLEFVIQGSREQLFEPDNLRSMLEFAALCEAEPTVSDVASIAEVLQGFLTRLQPYDDGEGVPGSAKHASAVVELLGSIDSGGLSAFLPEGHAETRILVQVKETSYMKLLDLSERLTGHAQTAFGDRLSYVEKGSAPLVGRAVREIIRGHLEGFVFCFTAIIVLIVVGIRSWQLGWISIIPNLLPLLTLGGLISLSYDRVDSDILAVATLGLGLAVDDTIHFMSRFKIELSRGVDVTEALVCTMRHTGVAIIRTTLILSLGFLPFALSGYWSIRMLGTYLVGVLFAALLADLLVLPALLKIAYRQRPGG